MIGSGVDAASQTSARQNDTPHYHARTIPGQQVSARSAHRIDPCASNRRIPPPLAVQPSVTLANGAPPQRAPVTASPQGIARRAKPRFPVTLDQYFRAIDQSRSCWPAYRLGPVPMGADQWRSRCTWPQHRLSLHYPMSDNRYGGQLGCLWH